MGIEWQSKIDGRTQKLLDILDSEQDQKIAVTMKVTDLPAVTKLSETLKAKDSEGNEVEGLKINTTILMKNKEKYLLTARIFASLIQTVCEKDCVCNLQMGSPVGPLFDR